jgi:hypothetical protein
VTDDQNAEENVPGINWMVTQMKYSKHLFSSNYGIALIKPSDVISVGDLCFWDKEGRATRILNIFDNHQVRLTRDKRDNSIEGLICFLGSGCK